MPSLHDPLTLARGPVWSNRLALAPLTNKQSHLDGSLSDDEIRWLVARARGGMGMVMTAAAFVARSGNAWAGQLGVHEDAMLPGLTRLADEIRTTGAVSSVQLHHGGIRNDAGVSGLPLVGPHDDEKTGGRALTTAEVQQLVDDFVTAAQRCDRAGFDGVEVHGAHGYLICAFLSSKNQRTDGYGGSLADRERFLREIVHGIRETTRPDFQVGLRLTPERMGIELSDAVETARWALDSGLLDYLDMSLWDVRKEPLEPAYAGTRLIDHFVSLDRGETRLTVAGKILGAADAQWCLDNGADAAVIGTGAILQHDFAARALADPDFVSVDQPVTRQHLEREHLGAPFINYLATGWKDFVKA